MNTTKETQELGRKYFPRLSHRLVEAEAALERIVHVDVGNSLNAYKLCDEQRRINLIYAEVKMGLEAMRKVLER